MSTRSSPKRKHHLVKLLLERDGHVCRLCGQEFTPNNIHGPHSVRSVTLDHIIPKNRGGSYHPANIALAHENCNSRRNSRMEGNLIRRPDVVQGWLHSWSEEPLTTFLDELI